MKLFKLLAICALLALLLVPVAVFGQEQTAPERGVIEFGFRAVTGDVYGRTTQTGTLPFSNGFRPELASSPLNTYFDYRSSFYVPRFDLQLNDLFGARNYLLVRSLSNGVAFEHSTLNRDQSTLVSFGQYGHYKAQFRFDQTPHVFSGTTRTLFTSGGNGVWTVPFVTQNALFSTLCGSVRANGSCSLSPSVTAISNAIGGAVAGTLVPGVAGAQSFVQQENRKAITGSMSWNIKPDVNVSALFSRENQVGTRPIGFVMGNGSTGYMAEAPEVIDYYTNTLKITSDFGRKHWDGLLGYQGSFFQNNTPNMVVANPFSTVYNATSIGPATGRMDLYPNNDYHQFVAQGAADFGKFVHLMASITPGFLRQNEAFQPLTTNTAVNLTPPTGYPSYLPASSLKGSVDTLAMNYTAVLKATKTFKVVAKYQHYKYDDNTPELLVRPVIADTAFLTSFHGGSGAWFDPTAPAASQDPNAITSNFNYYLPSEQSSFTTRLFDVGGTWFFTKKNSVKLGYQRGWTDRFNREVAENTEDTVYGALDMQLRKDLQLRVSGRHQNRVPQEYEIDPSNYYSRMVDQSTRVRNRGDISLEWDPTDRLSVSGFWGTLQDNYNQRGGVNSPTPLANFSSTAVKIAGSVLTPIYGPYYAYGVLNGIGRNYGVDVNYALSPTVTFYAEYAREKNTGVMIQGRTGNPGSTEDPINDLLTASKDLVNSYYAGFDVTASKKVDFSFYYNLSAGQSFVFSDGANCQVGDTPNSYCFDHFTAWKLDNLTSGGRTYQAFGAPGAGGFGYPENVNRIHEFGIITRFKLTDNLVPKFQYIFRQNDYKDWQTMVNPYSFTGGSYSFAGPATDPGGTSALQKMLWLGSELPSYRAHIFSATLEYHF